MPSTTAPRQTCFVDMPFGRKTDPKSGVEIDFDQVYEQGIRPAVEGAGLECVRGDREQTGGLIHTAMFARLLLSEFVIADMTSANPNVFYELGVRHAARPYTTIPLFATLGAPPFDVNGVRAIPYELSGGRLSDAAAAALRSAIGQRITSALKSPVAQDSPLFQLFDRFPGIEISHELTDVFRDRVAYSEAFRDRLAAARALQPREAALAELQAIEASLGDIATAERGVVVDLLLSYRAVEAWDAMITLVDRMAGDVREAPLTQQQLAFALNRRHSGGDRERALRVLKRLLDRHGDNAETLGLLGRIHKDRWRQASPDDPARAGWLAQAIDAYRRGFEAEPLDAFPGINALTLLQQQGGDEAEAEIRRLAPLVTFAAMRRGGDRSDDYWTVATVLELACLNGDKALARRCLPRVLALAQAAGERWMPRTTRDNVALIARRCGDAPETRFVHEVEAALAAAADG